MTINEKYLRFKGLQKDLDIVGMDAMRDTQDDFLRLNKEQMLQGQDNEGNRIGEYEFGWYADFKSKLNPAAGGTVDLKVSGNFHDGMFMNITAKNYLVDSRDGKTMVLLSWYPKAFGLSPDSKATYRSEYFFPAMMVRVRRQVNG